MASRFLGASPPLSRLWALGGSASPLSARLRGGGYAAVDLLSRVPCDPGIRPGYCNYAVQAMRYRDPGSGRARPFRKDGLSGMRYSGEADRRCAPDRPAAAMVLVCLGDGG